MDLNPACLNTWLYDTTNIEFCDLWSSGTLSKNLPPISFDKIHLLNFFVNEEVQRATDNVSKEQLAFDTFDLWLNNS